MAGENTFYKGKDLRIKVGGKPMFHSTSCSISISTTLEAIATKDTNGTINAPGNYEWSLSAETLTVNKAVAGTQADTFDLLTIQLKGEEVEIEMTTGKKGDILLKGTAYIESTGITADNGSNSTASYSFKGNGDLSLTRLTE
ncbi:hypothetical protein HXZ88_09165 [Myroides odoratimimus]|uniref:phage tail tube protein n=1 Tax=Myroides odoratimimus TaxID=76832 RepID=UPI002575C112|nr:phage tail tube protein [Myroides odoratimimus]MDM1065790.1 hypothetical protein [Myroides odoratimimus]MDM1514494.1 hypothetical protein [Myroides odoratimimus]MDM1535048.1 hypothetical protein [Myroides odoratimimus]MDM1674194.1 hypothetical protein [Myroides odoratimimus]MDX4973711.1 phage tail tube protein [Myroides odoratimimus]